MLTIDLTGRTALVIGGGRGIGAAVTQCLARAGAHVTFTHTGNPALAERLHAMLAEIRLAGGSVQAVALDACSSAETTALADRVAAERGRLDILVHNVGRTLARAAATVRDEEWREAVDLNLSAAFYGIRAVLPHMLKARYGRIILIGSSAVVSGGGGSIEYAAAKAGMTGLMTYLCKAHARDGVLTNVIHPCVIDTDLLRQRYADEAARAKLAAAIPAGRLGKPEDIAGLVAYLASPWGDYICGQQILVDGGRTVFG
jgi:3-oxoacyl-[acyl-carrier protein] reductase